MLRLSQEHSRLPTEDEVAEEAGMKLSKCRGLLDQYSRAQVASLDPRLERDGGSGVEYGALVEDSAAVNPQSQTNVEEVRVTLPARKAT
ncbi:MAG TPA: sigma-70 domain-containing protein [Rubrobacteraceae bacterium]|nr:sigma-70 domain-containing protein [Rubrobacteraceae bacterium]